MFLCFLYFYVDKEFVTDKNHLSMLFFLITLTIHLHNNSVVLLGWGMDEKAVFSTEKHCPSVSLERGRRGGTEK